MSLIPSILGWVAVALASLVVLVGLASLWPVRVHVEADQHGGSGSLSWLGWSYRQDRRRRTWELRLARWRLVRRPLADEGADPTSDGGAKEQDARKRTRPRMSTPGTLRLARSGLREAQRLLRHVHVERLRAGLVIGTPDPALTGELYGYGAALAATARTAWPEAKVDLGVDFLADRPRGSVAGTIRTRPIWWAAGAVRVGWVFLRERRRSRGTRHNALRRYRPCNPKTSSSR